MFSSSDIETRFGLSSGTVRQYIFNHPELVEGGVFFKIGKTWACSVEDAYRIWGDETPSFLENIDDMLTAKERKIIEALREEPDATYQRVAEIIGNETKTVGNHMTRLYKKLGIRGKSTEKRIRLYMILGWIDTTP